MIVLNRDRFFAGGHCGVIQNDPYCCALITDRTSAVVSSFSGEWDGKNHHPVAEAFLCETLTRKQVRDIHDVLLKELDQCGTNGLDLAAAIEQVFALARYNNFVTCYQNNAALLLAARDTRTERTLKGEGQSFARI
ncbi:MAG: hypothetical protein ACLPX9_17590 [Rhodomicrobium sp.]